MEQATFEPWVKDSEPEQNLKIGLYSDIELNNEIKT